MKTISARFISFLSRRFNQRILFALQGCGENITVGRWVRIENPQCVMIGDNAELSDGCWLSVVIENKERGRRSVTLSPELSIGIGSYIGRFGTIACVEKVSIGRDVMISDRVFIGDSTHGHERIDLPICQQYLVSKGPVSIGDGTWIGIGVSILANVKIGRNCVIGAGSVVTRDVPDFSVAVGVPARVIRSTDAKP
ncbi:acyltransferase [Burkholderiales bacterium]|nr:acyltransferase [Burkholderiales bacterium]